MAKKVSDELVVSYQLLDPINNQQVIISGKKSISVAGKATEQVSLADSFTNPRLWSAESRIYIL